MSILETHQLANGDQIEAHNTLSRLHDNSGPHHPYFKDHDAHGPNPIYRSVGWDNHGSCGYTTCPHHDAELFGQGVMPGKADRADFAGPEHWEAHTIEPHKTPLVAHESVVDREHLLDLDIGDVEPKSNGRLPRLIPHNGALHIMDGHHRLLADAMNGRTTTVSVYKGV